MRDASYPPPHQRELAEVLQTSAEIRAKAEATRGESRALIAESRAVLAIIREQRQGAAEPRGIPTPDRDSRAANGPTSAPVRAAPDRNPPAP